ncbi:MAG: putative UDP-kanosamine synthase oxidoreductase subunit [Syntrophomonadaceae bacterium]|nr:putative UDP-kanosamine synthase oxidoreductase subunit [Bacillota bacterium]
MTLRTVVIGLGKQSRDDHLPAIAQSANFELVGICDTDKKKAEEISTQYGVTGYDNLGEMINSQDFQVAIVSIPHHVYLNVISALVTAGKHIIKEKPFATSVAEARQILQILRGGSSYLGVTVQRRFNPIYRTFHQLKKYIGKIYSIEGAYTMNVAALDEGWRASKDLSGGGALMDMGYHFVDLLIWYFGMPASVTARMTRGNRPGQKYNVEDTVHLLFDYCLEFQYDEKVVGNFVISRVYPEKQERVRVFGTNGVIEVSRGLVRRLDANGKEIERLERQGGWPSAAVEQLDHFAERIRQFVPGSLPDYTEHLQHVAVIEAAYESDRSGTSCHPSDILKLIQELKEEKQP